MTNTVSQSSTGTSLMYPKTKSDPAWALWAETLAPFEAHLQLFMERANQTCRDTFSQWSTDANPGGFSAKMFLHLMYLNSDSRWTVSHTLWLLCQLTVRRLQVRAGIVSSWQDSITKKPLIGSGEFAKTPKQIRAMAKRGVKTLRPYWVLIHDEGEADIVKIMFSRDQRGAYVCYHTMSGSLFKDSLLDGLTEYLTRLANAPSETQSQSRSQSGSESG